MRGVTDLSEPAERDISASVIDKSSKGESPMSLKCSTLSIGQETRNKG